MNLKIVHVIVGLDNGGAELFLLRLVQSSCAANDYMIVSLTGLGANGEKFLSAGIPVISLNLRNIVGLVKSPFKLYHLLRNFKPDIVQTWMVHSDLIGGFFALIARVPIIIWGVRTTDYSVESSSTRLLRYLASKLSFFIPDKIVCAANAACFDAINFGYDSSKCLVIQNGFDDKSLSNFLGSGVSIRNSILANDKTVLVGCLGRYNPAKDHANFVAAAGLIAARFPQVLFLMVGRGLEARNFELMQLIKATGVPDRFVLLGERTDPAACLDAMDVFVLSSCTEGFPNVLGEAMAMGLPCVSTDVGDAALLMGSREWLVRARDSKALADKVSELLTLPEEQRERLGAQARQRVAGAFSMNASTQKFMSLYTSLVKSKP
jgi:glycosyltransferase involved in cell wall biosynthesis